MSADRDVRKIPVYITGQAWAKARLIRTAGQLRPITLTIALSKRRSS